DEVRAKGHQRTDGDAWHAEDAAGDVLGDLNDEATKNPTLAVPIVEHVARVDHRGAEGVLERRIAREAGRVDQQAREEELVYDALLDAGGERREVREIAQDRGRVGDVR